jgi:hypothetical protein
LRAVAPDAQAPGRSTKAKAVEQLGEPMEILGQPMPILDLVERKQN